MKRAKGDLFILGSYNRGGNMGRYITIYYGSFMKVYGHLRRQDQGKAQTHRPARVPPSHGIAGGRRRSRAHRLEYIADYQTGRDYETIEKEHPRWIKLNRRPAPGMIGEERFTKYAVLVPIVNTGGADLLLKKGPAACAASRARYVSGGKIERENPQTCAVREAAEELCFGKARLTSLDPAISSSLRLISSFTLLSGSQGLPVHA